MVPERLVLHAGQTVHAAAGRQAQQKCLRLVACAITQNPLTYVYGSDDSRSWFLRLWC